MPIPVLYFITELSIGGAQTALLHLLKGLNRDRYFPIVACLYNGDGVVAQGIRALGIPVFDAQMRHKVDLRALLRLYRWVRSKQLTILHTSLFHANLPGRFIGRLAGIPVVISSERTMAMESEWRYRLNRWTIRLVDRVVIVSTNVGEFCVTHIGLPVEKLTLIYNGVAIASPSRDSRQDAREELGLSQQALVIGAVSRLDLVKGVDYLIHAFSQVEKEYDAHLVVIGDGQEHQTLASLVEASGLSERVHWAGYRLNVPDLLPAFDIFVQPSLHEGLPNTVLEAMAAGLPVVATKVGGTPEVVVDGETGLLVPAGDPNGLAQAIIQLLEDPGMRRRMGEAGERRVKLHFSIEETVRKTEQLYESLLTEKGLS